MNSNRPRRGVSSKTQNCRKVPQQHDHIDCKGQEEYCTEARAYTACTINEWRDACRLERSLMRFFKTSGFFTASVETESTLSMQSKIIFPKTKSVASIACNKHSGKAQAAIKLATTKLWHSTGWCLYLIFHSCSVRTEFYLFVLYLPDSRYTTPKPPRKNKQDSHYK